MVEEQWTMQTLQQIWAGDDGGRARLQHARLWPALRLRLAAMRKGTAVESAIRPLQRRLHSSRSFLQMEHAEQAETMERRRE